MPLTFEQLEELQHEALADDLPITIDMCTWTIAQARAYFESGGLERPLVGQRVRIVGLRRAELNGQCGECVQ